MAKRTKKKQGHWRQDQRTDPYFQQAKAEGYRARSAYKLIQIDKKFGILRRGQSILDLGAAPGSWSQVSAKAVGRSGRVVAVDLTAIEPLPGVIGLQGDITAPEVQAEMIERAGGPVDVVLCDAAPNTSGIALRDHALSIELVYAALDVACRALKPGGHLVTKVFEGEDMPQLLVDLRGHFELVKPHYPDATRREGKEIFVICKGFKGGKGEQDQTIQD